MGDGLTEVFSFYIQQLGNLFDLMRNIPIFENISLFHVIIALGILSIFFKIIKYGYNEEISMYRSIKRKDKLQKKKERRK